MIKDPFLLFGICLIGMLIHFLKKKIKGETITEILGYFRDNPKNTFIAFVATIIGYLGYMQSTTNPDFFALFGVGYLADSFFNRFDKNEKV